MHVAVQFSGQVTGRRVNDVLATAELAGAATIDKLPSHMGKEALVGIEGNLVATVLSLPDRVCMAFYGGTSRVTSRLDLGSGQGSGSSQTRLQSLPRCSERLSQAMPCRITLTVRPGFSGLLR